ncbi:hypothetical protein GYMLUDRAFT_253577 [Collybiopsis luxurians FD-317 M1]|uniref:Uncharacterized protein n=1 Tax=Collybiopsis luxurians FD-317 M1 TaxID=944289 RepID=A0A0D0AI26_9AGAR|nr:hypothetical protein GYMLUDRAFT_253577 [Collybiopsis luxurians FD-317 M1]
MSGKTHQFRSVIINSEVTRDLTWFSDVLQSAIGVRFVDAQKWADADAEFVGWTDTSNSRLAFVYAGNGLCYQLKLSPGKPVVDIFFRELFDMKTSFVSVSGGLCIQQMSSRPNAQLILIGT